MSLRTVTIGIRSRLDRVLCQIENHEAVAASAIRELHVALARASVQLARLSRSGDRMRAELARARHEAEQWRARAKECEQDARALECLRRSRHRSGHGRELEQRLLALDTLQKRLRRDMRALEDRHALMLERHLALRARETQTEAQQLVAEGGASEPNVEEVFERWETRITEQEYLVTPVRDAWGELESEYGEQEERAELMAELARLRGES